MRWVHDHLDERLGSDHGIRAPVHTRIDDMERRLDALLRAVGRIRAEQIQPSRRSPALSELTGELAPLLSWNDGPDGFSAQAGLWFNPPVPVEYFEGRVEVLHVTERIVELPFVFAQVAAAGPAPLRILDVGGGESTLALSLASLGHDVVLVDPRGSRLAHPRLTVEAKRLEELDPRAARFDLAISLSAIEHFGLGHYAGSGEADPRGDRTALARMRELLTPGGLLVLTVPIAPTASTDDFQRIYDPAGARDLLTGWEPVAVSAAWQRDRVTWTAGDLDTPQGDRGVALLAARRGT